MKNSEVMPVLIRKNTASDPKTLGMLQKRHIKELVSGFYMPIKVRIASSIADEFLCCNIFLGSESK